MSQVSDRDKGARLHDATTWTKAVLENLEVTKTYFQLRSYWVNSELQQKIKHPRALRFKVRASIRGVDLTVVRRRRLGVDRNNHPVYETSPHTTVKGFVKYSSQNLDAESLLLAKKILFLLPVDADVDLDNDFRILYDAHMWRPVSLNSFDSHIEIEGERETVG